MLRTCKAVATILLFTLLSAQASPTRYAVGQVWNYHTRVGDEGSLLKVQQIENAPAGSNLLKIYHISVVGFHLRAPNVVPMLPHAPVSQQTLDASVTSLSDSKRSFPPVEPGIEEWRAAHGGVYTITVAQMIETLDQMMAERVK